MVTNKNILITGGTGSFGKNFIKYIRGSGPNKIIVFSRDELKQHEMRIAGFDGPEMRYFIGDIRDKPRLYRAFNGVDIVIHAAALKQVPTAEYNPLETIKTNVFGAANIIDAAIDRGVEKLIALSSDKAANPINLYGASKLCADKLFIAANNYAGTKFSVVRYGNIAGSRGSVIPLFREQKSARCLTITDVKMTRFWMTLDEAVKFVVQSLSIMQGREVFIPKLPSFKIVDLASVIAQKARKKIVGIRSGEKLHETLVPVDESWHTLEYAHHFVIIPPDRHKKHKECLWCPPRFCYASDTNDVWLGVDDLKGLVREV